MTAASSSLDVINIPEHCGNAPRKIVIRDFLIALYNRDTEQVLAALTTTVRWELVGTRVMTDQAAVGEWLQAQPPAVSLQLHTVITHGTDCGADGTVTLHNGDSIRFSHTMIFSGHGKAANIKELRSYCITPRNR